MAGKSRATRCPATKKDGTPCRARPYPGFELCRSHAPELEELRSYLGKKGAWARDKKRGIERPEPTYEGPHLLASALGEEGAEGLLEEIERRRLEMEAKLGMLP